MTDEPSLIERTAKKMGWQLHGDFWWPLDSHGIIAEDAAVMNGTLTADGLIAIEDKLLRAGCHPDFIGDAYQWWRKDNISKHTSGYVRISVDPDRRTAAMLALVEVP